MRAELVAQAVQAQAVSACVITVTAPGGSRRKYRTLYANIYDRVK